MMPEGDGPSLRIRSCGLQHAGALARLHATLFEAAWDADTFKELMAFPGSLAFAAGPSVVGGVVGGVAGSLRKEPWGLILGRVVVDEAEILTLGVAESRRRLGIAGRLIDKLCQAASKRGAQRLHLEVAESNSAARALYAGVGFRELGRRRGYYERAGAPPEDALNLCLTLGQHATGGTSVGGPGGGNMDGGEAVTYNGASSHAPHEDMRASTAPANRIEQQCADKRLRMTGQRRVIARVLSEAEDHPDVEEVHRRAHAVDPRISLSTVYRTLRLFATKGILERHDFGAGRGRYEAAARTHHDHLIDLETGRVIEFSNEEIERLQQRVAQELGFQLVGHKLELYGVPVKRQSGVGRRGS
jgi:Fur family transcriptional regulator, ferric uptake regulator